MPREDQTDISEYESSYLGARDAILSLSEKYISAILLIIIGIFGLGLLVSIGLSVLDGTASYVAYPAAIFGICLIAFAAYELHHV
ncbi:hypothetical protein [Halosimplex halobium]|uniref:hypothetical protein n=1 Tax=Halosimplex halobium TaxID=3396618 RepID=UPI003F56B195